MFEKILVVANSGRMLARSALYIGLKPIVIDVFSDEDTRNLAYDFCQIPTLSLDYLIPAVEAFLSRHNVSHFIYGSGFEGHHDSLAYLNERLKVIGNQVKTFITAQQKVTLFQVLDRFNIPYPLVSFTQPQVDDLWLIKPLFSYGGVGIKRYLPGDEVNELYYWQRYQEGTLHSVLFLADGINAQVVGFNTQWARSADRDSEFIFCGIINSCELESTNKQTVFDWVKKLTIEFGLVGLNSLDFIHSKGQNYFLEINPRLPASMQLYGSNLLNNHISACQGVLEYNPIKNLVCRAYQVVYIEDDIFVPQFIDWPTYVVDVPAVGVLIRKGQPICSIIVHENNPQLVFAELADKQQQLITNLKGPNQDGIQRKPQ